MKLITQRDMIRELPTAYREEYGDYLEDPDSRGRIRGNVLRELEALDLETCSIGDVEAVLGNSGLTRMGCDLCGEEQGLLVRADRLDICPKCVGEMAELVEETNA